jgi:hypothetical protein
MMTNPFRAAAEAWLAAHAPPFPLKPTRHSELESTLKTMLAEHPESAHGWEAAMLWVRIGHIEPAHEIVQSGTQGFEAYLHGVIHRIEGDFWNAKYWFRQVRSAPLLEAIQLHIQQKYRTTAPSELPIAPTDNPSLAVDRCEQWFSANSTKHNPHSEEYLKAIEGIRWQSAAEWEGLWLWLERNHART